MKLINSRDEETIVEIVCAGIEWTWANATKYAQWDFLRDTCHGASLAMIGAGLDVARDDFEFLRNIARLRAMEARDNAN